MLTAAGGRTEARVVLADRLVLAHLAADVRGLLAEGQSLPPIPDAEPPTSLPTLRVDAEAGFACTGFSIRGLPAIGLQVSRNGTPPKSSTRPAQRAFRRVPCCSIGESLTMPACMHDD